jgi:hypothetical protein
VHIVSFIIPHPANYGGIITYSDSSTFKKRSVDYSSLLQYNRRHASGRIMPRSTLLQEKTGVAGISALSTASLSRRDKQLLDRLAKLRGLFLSKEYIVAITRITQIKDKIRQCTLHEY